MSGDSRSTKMMITISPSQSAVGTCRVVLPATAELLKRAERVFAEKQGALLSLAFHMTHNREDAEDVVGDAKCRVFKHVREGAVVNPEKLKSYVFRVTTNAALDFLKRKAKRAERPLLSDDALTEGKGERHYYDEALASLKFGVVSKGMETLHSALSQMSASDRAVLTMFYVDDLSIAEIADVMGCKSVNAAKTRLFRCRERVRAAILEIDPEFPNNHS